MINIKNLSYSYPSSKVFDNISLDFSEGKVYGLLGENGVGKTTLLKIICGLLKAADGNQCVVEGENPFSRTPSLLQKVFFVPEHYDVPKIKITEYADSMGQFYPNYSRELLLQLLSELEVNPDAKFTQLSTGQQKKAFLAFALSLGTKILLLDEPSNGLDIPSKTILRKIIARSITDDRLFIISTHQVRDLENTLDHVVILKKDRVMLDASVSQIESKLHFGSSSHPMENALYTEQTVAGYNCVTVNENDLDSRLNLEMLFNAVIKNPSTIENLFKSENNEQ